MKSKPGPIVTVVFRPILMRAGICGVIEVADRRTGAPTHVSLVVYQDDGARYLLATYGIAAWVRNLRAAGRGRVTVRGKTQPFVAVEVEPTERGAVIAIFRARAPGMVQKDFDLRPDPTDHPAFRLDPDPGAGSVTAPPGT